MELVSRARGGGSSGDVRLVPRLFRVSLSTAYPPTVCLPSLFDTLSSNNEDKCGRLPAFVSFLTPSPTLSAPYRLLLPPPDTMRLYTLVLVTLALLGTPTTLPFLPRSLAHLFPVPASPALSKPVDMGRKGTSYS